VHHPLPHSFQKLLTSSNMSEQEFHSQISSQ